MYGVYTLWEVSRRNNDSSQGANPLRRYHNSWGIFPIARTCPYINKFIIRGNCKINTDRDADGLFSNLLSLTRYNRALSRNLSTTYEMGKPRNKCWQTAYLNHLASTLAACTNMLQAWLPCYEHHTTVTSVHPVRSLWHVATPNNAHTVPFILWLPEQ